MTEDENGHMRASAYSETLTQVQSKLKKGMLNNVYIAVNCYIS
jgi:hypothetical protein